jgi:hypothetical protein
LQPTLPQHLAISLSFPHNEPSLLPKASFEPFPSSYCDMGDQSGSSHFHELFESAFQSYETNTGISLTKNPLAERLQSCHSVEDITTLVQDQASTVSELGGNDRIMKSIKSTVSILATLSATASLGDTIGLVSQKGADSVFTYLTDFYSHSTP